MRYIIFDTETTGLSKNDEVIQVSAIIADENFKATNLINFYCYTTVKISRVAFLIHQIERDKLYELSKGRVFEDNIGAVTQYVDKDTYWVGYNVGFDIRLCNQTMYNNGLNKIDFGTSALNLGQKGVHNFDLMKALANTMFGGRNRKLSEAAKLLPYSENQLAAMYGKFVKLQKGSSDKMMYHDSRFDAMITWLLLAHFNKHFK